MILPSLLAQWFLMCGNLVASFIILTKEIRKKQEFQFLCGN